MIYTYSRFAPDLQLLPLRRLFHADAWLDVDVNRRAFLRDAKCNMWHEPALYFEGDELFLVLRCLAFDLRAKSPTTESGIFVYAATPEGNVKNPGWRYTRQTGGSRRSARTRRAGTHPADITRAQDGTLLAIPTPDD